MTTFSITVGVVFILGVLGVQATVLLAVGAFWGYAIYKMVDSNIN